MKKRWAILLASGLTSGALYLAAGPAMALTLEESLIAAYESNPQILAERESLKAQSESINEALSNWRPTVNVNASAGKSRSKGDSFRGTTEEITDPRSAGVSVSQPLYRGGRTVAATNAAEANFAAAKYRLFLLEQGILQATVTSYMDVLRDEALRELQQNNVKVLERHLEATQIRFEVGELTRTDVAQAEARLARAKANLIAAEGDLAATRAVLQNLTKLNPYDLQIVEGIDGLPGDMSAALGQALLQHPSVQQSLSLIKAAEYDLEEVTGQKLPEIKIEADANYGRDTAFEGSESENTSLMARVTVPLYQAGRVSAQKRAALDQIQKSQYDLDAARRDVEQEVIQAWQAYVTAKAQSQSFESEIEASNLALEGVQEESNFGERTVLDVLDAEQELLDAKVGLVRAHRDHIVSQYRLYAAMGQLDAASLSLPVDIFAPDEVLEERRGNWGSFAE